MIHEQAPRAVVVVSFFPGNDSDNAVGGFDWWPDDAVGRAAAAAELAHHAANVDEIGSTSLTCVRLTLPEGLHVDDVDAVTEWLDDDASLRELPAQS